MAQMNFQCFFFLRTTNLGSEGTMPETIYGKENWIKKENKRPNFNIHGCFLNSVSN